MKDYKTVIEDSFWFQIKNFNNLFLDLIFNRISYLELDPFKYSSVSILNDKLYSLRVIDKNNDIKIIFKIINKTVYVVFLYSMKLNLEQIRKIFAENNSLE